MSKRKSRRQYRGRTSRREAFAKVKIPDAVLKDALLMLDRPMGDAYAGLGAQLETLERPLNLMANLSLTSMGETTRAEKIDYKSKAHEWLKKYWKNIWNEGCGWWKDNKDKTGEKLVAGLSAAILPTIAVTAPTLLFLVPVAVLIAVILIKAGLNTICQMMTEEPPRP